MTTGITTNSGFKGLHDNQVGTLKKTMDNMKLKLDDKMTVLIDL